jgi:hypothetical protein
MLPMQTCPALRVFFTLFTFRSMHVPPLNSHPLVKMEDEKSYHGRLTESIQRRAGKRKVEQGVGYRENSSE